MIKLIKRLLLKFLYPPNNIRYLLSLFEAQMDEVYFIQIGANDGISNDPASMYKKRSNWGGVLIEPQQLPFQELQKNFAEKRYELLNIAIADDSSTKKLSTITFSKSRWATGLATFNKDTLIEHFKSGYVEEKAHAEGIVLNNSRVEYDKYIEEKEVQSLSLKTLLTEIKKPVDAIFIDVEGYDYEIIKQLDFKQCNQLKLLLYESKHLNILEKKEAINILIKNKFHVFSDGINTLGLRDIYIPLNIKI